MHSTVESVVFETMAGVFNPSPHFLMGSRRFCLWAEQNSDFDFCMMGNKTHLVNLLLKMGCPLYNTEEEDEEKEIYGDGEVLKTEIFRKSIHILVVSSKEQWEAKRNQHLKLKEKLPKWKDKNYGLFSVLLNEKQIGGITGAGLYRILTQMVLGETAI